MEYSTSNCWMSIFLLKWRVIHVISFYHLYIDTSQVQTCMSQFVPSVLTTKPQLWQRKANCICGGFSPHSPAGRASRRSVPLAHLHHEPTNKYNQSHIYIQIGFLALFMPIWRPSTREQIYSLYTPISYLSSNGLLIVSFFRLLLQRNFPLHFISGYWGACLADMPRVFHHFLAGEIMTIDIVTSLGTYRCLLVDISASAPLKGRKPEERACV